MTDYVSYSAKPPILLALALMLLALVACAQSSNPEGWSGGVIGDDTLYIGTAEGELLALDRDSGQTKWRFELKGEEEERAVYGTPTLSGDTVYVGGYDGVLYALSRGGDLKGQEPIGGSIVGSPYVAEDLVLVGSSDGNMYAFDISEEYGELTFTERWRFPTDNRVWSTPAVVNGVAYFGSLDHNVYAVSLGNGSQLWRFQTGGAVVAGPVVARGRVYIGSFDGVFYAIDAATGEESWRFEEASRWYWGSAVTTEGTIYAPSLDGNLYALDSNTGRLRWTLETEGAIVGSPVIISDMIAVPSADGKVRLARLRDGLPLDACNIGKDVRTSLVERDGTIYLGARDHSIRALRIKSNGNPDEEWAHFTDRDDPLPRDRTPAC